MSMVFPDTVGLLATWDVRDQWHDAAERVVSSLIREGRPLVSTDFVLAECGNAASRKPYRPRVPALREQLAKQGRIVAAEVEDFAAIWDAYRLAGIGAAGFVVQMSFFLMRRLGISEAFTNDRHFKAAGFMTLF